MKLTVIGGASAYTPDIVDGLLREKETFAGWELALHDINETHLAIVRRLAERMAAAAGADLRVTATVDRPQALEGARFVLNQPRAGGLPARHLDEQIALEQGVIGQETLGAGGIAFALRSIPLVLEIVRETARLAPSAWVINYANPCGMVTEAVLTEQPDARFIGLCDMPTGVQWGIARLMRLDPHRLSLSYGGINHGGWIQQVLLDGQDMLPRLRRWTGWLPGGLIPPTGEEGGTLRLFIRHGLIPDPYLRYYYFRDAVLGKMLRKGRTRAAEVIGRLPLLYEHYEEASRQPIPQLTLHRGHASHSDLASQVIATMAAGRRQRFVIQHLNGGAVPDLPAEGQAQFPALLSAEGFARIPVAPLPAELPPLLVRVKESERLAVKAALTADRRVAVEAMAVNPLVDDRRKAERLVEAYLAAHRPLLPQFHAG